jgi:hypothetical protein
MTKKGRWIASTRYAGLAMAVVNGPGTSNGLGLELNEVFLFLFVHKKKCFLK